MARQALLAACLALLAAAAWPRPAEPRAASPALASAAHASAEARLIAVYRLVGQGHSRAALEQAEALVRDHPNFQLAQLVYGDLLAARTRAVRTLGDVPPVAASAAADVLGELREESALRLRALRERPPAGHVPAPFLKLSPRSPHAIAVDTSRARLYLFENNAHGLRLVADYYVSVGKSGAGKVSEGDMRTPLGIYHVTSQLERSRLQDFYGAGALPINYPNPHDLRRGKTGSGIWLHGTPPQQYARAPRASDGCVVLANPDLEHLLRTVAIRATPVVIGHGLQWVPAGGPQPPEVRAFTDALAGWRAARSGTDLARLQAFYTPDMSFGGKGGNDSARALKAELSRTRGRDLELKDLSYLRWTDGTEDIMVVTFGEVPQGARTGPTKRQYWLRTGPQWRIFYEGVIG